MITFIRTNSDDKDFLKLVRELDDELRIRDGDDHVFYSQLNKVADIKHVIVACENGLAVGCGAIREFGNGTIEIKRMFVLPAFRNKGIASQVLQRLEAWASELNYRKCILETGKNQPEAISLYQKNNYSIIPNFGKYAGVENSICFEKMI